MGGDIEGADEYGSNGEGPWYDVQVSVTDIASVRQKKFGGDGVYVEFPGDVSPQVG